MKANTISKLVLATVFFLSALMASGQTNNYSSYNWQRGQSFQDTTRFNDTIFTTNDGNSTQWDEAYQVRVREIGSGNMFLGTNAGANNVFVGVKDGDNNTFLGISSGTNNSSGYANTALGYQSLFSNDTGITNTSIGYQTLYRNVRGSRNTALGTDAGFRNNGSDNVFVGYHTGFDVSNPDTITGSFNVIMGNDIGLDFNTANQNVMIGYRSAYLSTTAQQNVFVGERSGYSNTTGNFNTSIGSQAGYGSVDATHNVFVGYRTNFGGDAGNSNVGVGATALYSATGQSNTAVGTGALYTNTNSNNTALGLNAGRNTNNTFGGVYLGFRAGENESSNNKLHIANNQTESLIEGDFSARTLTINGDITSENFLDVASSSLDFPSTSAQSSSDLTITYTGAVVGDVVCLGTPNASVLSNSSYTAWVSATNTVTVRFNNYSASPQDPASGTFTVKILR